MIERYNDVIAFAKAWFKEMSETKFNVLKECLSKVFGIETIDSTESDISDYLTLNPQSEKIEEVGELIFVKNGDTFTAFHKVA